MWPNRWKIPIALAAVGATLLGLGAVWAVVSGIAIPDQDPTPAMRDYARFHNRIVDASFLGGAAALLAALGSALTLLGRRLAAARRRA